MKFTTKNNTGDNPANTLRQIGFRYLGMANGQEEMVFYRPVGQDAYPRFHLYLQNTLQAKKSNDLFFSIHFDQRRTVYQGSTAHSGEYEGELLEKEVEKIRKVFESEG